MPAQQRFYDMYGLASRARDKLQREADEPEHNLRLLVGLTEELRRYRLRDACTSRYSDLFKSLDDDSDSEEDEVDDYPALHSHQFGTSTVIMVEGDTSQDLSLQRYPTKILRPPLLPTPVVTRATGHVPDSSETPDVPQPEDPTCHLQRKAEPKSDLTDNMKQACGKLTSMLFQPGQDQPQEARPKSGTPANVKIGRADETAATLAIRWGGISLLATVRAA